MFEIIMSELNSRILFIYFFLILFLFFLMQQIIFRLRINGKRIPTNSYLKFLGEHLPNYKPVLKIKQSINEAALNQEFAALYQYFLSVMSHYNDNEENKQEIDDLLIAVESLLKRGDRKIRKSLLSCFIKSFAQDTYEGKIKLPNFSKHLGSSTRKHFLTCSDKLINK